MSDFGDLFDVGEEASAATQRADRSFVVELRRVTDDKALTLHFDERNAVDETGGVIQAASLALADELRRLPMLCSTPLPADLVVLDVGCGAGVVGIAAAACLDEHVHVVLTDGDRTALQLARDNAVKNGAASEPRVSFVAARWCDLPAKLADDLKRRRPMLLLAADVCYDDASCLAFVDLLDDLLRANERALAHVALKRRGDGDVFDAFVSGLRKRLAGTRRSIGVRALSTTRDSNLFIVDVELPTPIAS